MSNEKNSDDYRRQLEYGFSKYKQDLKKPYLDPDTVEAKLEKIVSIQEKQLYWIRIIGLPFLMAAIGSLIVLIIRMVS